MKVLSKVAKIQQGQAKAQAKGAKRKPVVTQGLGVAIVNAMEAVNTTVRESILALVGHNPETIAQSIMEVEGLRDARIKACAGERKAQKIASLRVMFTRITVILRAFHKGYNVDKIKACKSFSEMYAFASNKAKRADGRAVKPFSKGQADQWAKQVKRLCGDIPGKNATATEKGVFSEQLARMEQHCVDVLGALSKYALVSRIPVRDMLGLVSKKKQHIRLAKAA